MFWIRADGSRTMGFGHIMRMVALAERADDRGIPVTFVVTADPVATALPRDRGFVVRSLRQPEDVRWLEDVVDGDVTVFDGYHFSPELVRAARSRGARVLAVDDLGTAGLPAQLVLNQNPGPHPADVYVTADEALLGPRYALVRKEFTRRRRRRGGPAETVVATFGGSDTAGMGQRFVSAMARTPLFPDRVLVEGPGAAEVDADAAAAAGVEVLRSPADLAAIFDRADVVVSAAGSTTWELLTMGLPTILVEVAPNQAGIGRAMRDAAAALFAGRAPVTSEALVSHLARLGPAYVRSELSERAMETVDGRGADRVLDALLAPGDL